MSGLAWSPDSKWIALSIRESPEEPNGVFLLSVDTGERGRLTKPPPNSGGDGWPAFSPDGRTLAFNRFGGYYVSDLYLLPLSTDLQPSGEPRRLAFQNGLSFSPTWTRDGRELIFSFYTSTGASLWRVAAAGSQREFSKPQRLAPVGEEGNYPTISRDGRRLAYTRQVFDWNIWRQDISGSGTAAERQLSSVHALRLFPQLLT